MSPRVRPRAKTRIHEAQGGINSSLVFLKNEAGVVDDQTHSGVRERIAVSPFRLASTVVMTWPSVPAASIVVTRAPYHVAVGGVWPQSPSVASKPNDR